jgi:hypothetical protein
MTKPSELRAREQLQRATRLVVKQKRRAEAEAKAGEDAGSAGANPGCLVSIYADGRFQEHCTLAHFLTENTALCSEELHHMFCCFAWGRLWEIGGGAAQRYGVKLYEPGDEERDFSIEDPAEHGAGEDADRCEHGMFYSGAGACPQCGGGAE